MKSVDETEDLDSIDEQKFAGLLREAIGADVPHEVLSLDSWRMTSQISRIDFFANEAKVSPSPISTWTG